MLSGAGDDAKESTENGASRLVVVGTPEYLQAAGAQLSEAQLALLDQARRAGLTTVVVARARPLMRPRAAPPLCSRSA